MLAGADRVRRGWASFALAMRPGSDNKVCVVDGGFALCNHIERIDARRAGGERAAFGGSIMF